jgi:hypothetical protein
MAANLSTLARGPATKSYTKKQLKQIRQWVMDDWESHDMDRDLVKVVLRLLNTLEPPRRRSKR